MSLISDALKTAQRERSGQSKPDAGGEPLLEGFFPYISSSAPEGRPNRQRAVIISIVGGIVIGTAAWVSFPLIKRSLEQSKKVAPISSPTRTAITPPKTPPVQIVQAADTTKPVALTRDSTPTATDAAPPPPTLGASARKSPQNEPKTVVGATDRSAIPRDSQIAQPSEPLPTAPDTRPTTRRNFEAEAVAAYNAGDYTAARSLFESAVRNSPTASGWTNYGVTLEKLGEPRAAIRAYRNATGIDATYFNAWLYMARVYNLLGDGSQAVPLFDRARELDPNNSDVNADLAELEYKAGAFSEARRFAEVAVRSKPANGRAQYYLALAADTLKDRPVARQAFEDYLRVMVGQEKDNAASMGYARVRLQELKGKP
jgi:Flp pilus assembly protein TadD